MACLLLIYKLAAYFLGQTGFGEYVIARRTIAFLYLPLILGQGIAIPRYIALSKGNADSVKSQNADGYFISGLFIGTIVVFVFLIVFNLFSSTFAYLFFGDNKYSYFIFPIGISIVGLSLHLLVYSYYRGHLMMPQAQSLQVINKGVLPLMVFAIPNITPSKLFLAMGSGQIVTCGIVMCLIFKGMNFDEFNRKDIEHKAKELLRYGIVRVPGEFALMGLLTLPVTFTAHISGVVRAGFVGFGVSMLNLVGALFAPIGLILLPSTSKLVAENKIPSLKREIAKLLKISISLTVLIVLVFEVFADPIIKLYLGQEFHKATNIVRYIMLGALPYVVYVVVRNVLDGLYVKPLNTLNLLAALMVFLISFQLNPNRNVQISLCVALFVLGILTMYSLRNVFNKKWEEND